MSEPRAEREHAPAGSDAWHEVFDSLLGVGRIGVVRIDCASRRFVTANHAVVRLLGYDADELAQRTVTDIVHPEHRETCTQWLDELLRSQGEEHHAEARCLRKDGSVVRVRFAARTVIAGGEVACIEAVVQDRAALDEAERKLGERKALEASLHDAEAAMLAMFNTTSVGMAQVDPVTRRFVHANAAFSRMTGYEHRELLELRFDQLTHPEDIAEDLQQFGRILAGETEWYSREKRYVRKDGTTIWVQVTANLIRDSAGVPLRTAGVALDVTERRAAEERLRHSEAQLTVALTAAGMATWRLDPGGAFAPSRAAAAMHGYADDETWTEQRGALAVHPEDRARVHAALLRALGTGERFQQEYRTVWPDGSLHWIASAAQLELDARGQPTGGLIGTVCDITERKRQEALLRAADRQKDEFLAMLAHELRNPLAPIRNASEALSRTLGTSPALQTPLAVLMRQTAQLTRLVDDLLDVSRIAQERIVLHFEPLDLATLIEQALETVEPVLRKKRHRLTLALGDWRLYVRGDRARLVQSIGNVLQNAVKYTDAGGEIRLDVRAVDEDVEIAIADTGSGISAELLPHVFDLFVQGERTLDRSQGGLGIGLSVVKRLVEMHGGRVSAASAGVGHGATFTLRLPRMESPAAAEKEPAEPPVGYRAKVLVVDDNADAADTVAMLLEMNGHEVESVYSALSALDAVEQFRPDVVFLDIGLPQMDGYEVARRIRLNGPLRNVRLVALTGYGQVEDRERALAAGFDDQLVKPVDLAELERVLTPHPH